MNRPARHVECTVPILPVRDLSRALRFYTQTLDFQLNWGGEAGSTICSVSKDGCAVMLREVAMPCETGEATASCWVWIGLEDDSLFHLYRERAVKIRQEPKNYSWAYEMKFEDIDGNVLWLGTEPRTDLPFADQKPG